MSEEQFKELEKLLKSVLDCKTQPHRKLAIGMIISVLHGMINPPRKASE